MGMRNCAGNLIAGLTVMDDILMRNVLNQTECTEYVLQTIMGQKELKVLECVVQKDYKNLQGRSAILDCVARDAEDRRYDVEIQNDGDAASPQRARYHSGLMDMHMLRPGQKFSELPESHVIFITEDDVLGHGLPIYHAGRDGDMVSGRRCIWPKAGQRTGDRTWQRAGDRNRREECQAGNRVIVSENGHSAKTHGSYPDTQGNLTALRLHGKVDA